MTVEEEERYFFCCGKCNTLSLLKKNCVYSTDGLICEPFIHKCDQNIYIYSSNHITEATQWDRKYSQGWEVPSQREEVCTETETVRAVGRVLIWIHANSPLGFCAFQLCYRERNQIKIMQILRSVLSVSVNYFVQIGWFVLLGPKTFQKPYIFSHVASVYLLRMPKWLFTHITAAHWFRQEAQIREPQQLSFVLWCTSVHAKFRNAALLWKFLRHCDATSFLESTIQTFSAFFHS